MKTIRAGIFFLLAAFPLLTQSQPAATDQFSQIDGYLFNGDYERAALLAERLYGQDKKNARLYSQLKAAYLGLKEYGKLDSLIAEQLRLSPGNTDLFLDQMELRLRQGALDRAELAAGAYLERARKDTLAYVDLASRYLASGYAEEAIKVYEKARRNLLKPTLFASNLAETYRSLRRWREALEEYLNGLETGPANSNLLSRLSSLLNDVPSDDADVDTFLERELAKKPSPLHYRLKGEWELRKGNYDAALAAFEEADRRGGAGGQLLLDLARKISFSNPEKMPALAATYEKSYSKSPELPQLLFLLARAQVDLGQFTAARAAYEKILTGSPLEEDKKEARFELAGLMLDYLAQPDSSLIFIEEAGLAAHPFWRQPAALLKARAMAALNRFDEARTFLSRVSPRSAPWGEEMDFLLAEWDFYFLKFDEAEKEYTALLDAFPRGERANDALRRLALIKNMGPSTNSPLSLFAAFLKDLAQFKEREAFSRLADLEGSSPDLAAEAYFAWGLYLTGKKRRTEAGAAFEKIGTAYPKTGEAPLALEKLGELAEESGDWEAAKTRYQTVLEQYPEAVNAESARGKLRRLLERSPQKNQKTEGKS